MATTGGVSGSLRRPAPCCSVRRGTARTCWCSTICMPRTSRRSFSCGSSRARSPPRRVLVLCAYRDVDPTVRDPLSSALAELVRESRTRAHVPLTGLTEHDVAEYVELSTGVEPAARLVKAIHSETEGNPLFMAEVVRLLAGEGHVDDAGAHLRIPPGVRAVIGQRVRPTLRALPGPADRGVGPGPGVRSRRSCASSADSRPRRVARRP